MAAEYQVKVYVSLEHTAKLERTKRHFEASETIVNHARIFFRPFFHGRDVIFEKVQ